MRTQWLFMAASVALVACSGGNPGSSGTTAGSGSGSSSGTSSTGGSSGSSGTSGDAGVVSCGQSAAAACGNCPPSWNDALAQACPNPQFEHSVAATCGDVQVYGLYGVDTGTQYIYAVDGGALLAIVADGNAGMQCVGGPSSFALPDCPTGLRDPCADALPGLSCGDAGACGPDEYCVRQSVSGPGLPPDDIHFHCAPVPPCDASSTCNCFLDAGVCLGPDGSCAIAGGTVDCTYSSP